MFNYFRVTHIRVSVSTSINYFSLVDFQPTWPVFRNEVYRNPPSQYRSRVGLGCVRVFKLLHTCKRLCADIGSCFSKLSNHLVLDIIYV